MGPTPDFAGFPSPEEFSGLIGRLGAVEPGELRLLWGKAASPRQIPHLEELLAASQHMSMDLQNRMPWERTLLAAGYEGGAEVEAWLDLRGIVESVVAEWQKSRAMLLAHTVVIHAGTDLVELQREVRGIIAYLKRGGSLGVLTLFWRKPWKKAVDAIRVNGSPPSALVHFQAVDSHLTLMELRRGLRHRWSSQAEPIGLPAFGSLGEPAEPVLRRYADMFVELLEWWGKRSAPIRELMESTGFEWDTLRNREIGRSSPTASFDLDAHLLGEPLAVAVAARLSVARQLEAEERLGRLARELSGVEGATGPMLLAAVRDRNPEGYAAAYGSFLVLARRE